MFLHYITLDNGHMSDEELEEENSGQPVLNDNLDEQNTEIDPVQQDLEEEEKVIEPILNKCEHEVKEDADIVSNYQRDIEDDKLKLGQTDEEEEGIKLPMKDKDVGSKLEVECVLEQYKTEAKKEIYDVQKEQEDEGTDNEQDVESNTSVDTKPSLKYKPIKPNENAEWSDHKFKYELEVNSLLDDQSYKIANEIESMLILINMKRDIPFSV